MAKTKDTLHQAGQPAAPEVVEEPADAVYTEPRPGTELKVLPSSPLPGLGEKSMDTALRPSRWSKGRMYGALATAAAVIAGGVLIVNKSDGSSTKASIAVTGQAPKPNNRPGLSTTPGTASQTTPESAKPEVIIPNSDDDQILVSQFAAGINAAYKSGDAATYLTPLFYNPATGKRGLDTFEGRTFANNIKSAIEKGRGLGDRKWETQLEDWDLVMKDTSDPSVRKYLVRNREVETGELGKTVSPLAYEVMLVEKDPQTGGYSMSYYGNITESDAISMQSNPQLLSNFTLGYVDSYRQSHGQS